MANNLSDYLETALINHVLRNSALTSPTTVYAALFTVAPGEAGGGTEVTGNAYARQAVTFSAPSGGATSNSADVTFPVTTPSTWGTIVAVGIFDASSAGNLLIYAPLTANKTVAAGDQFKFPATTLTFALD